MQELLQETKDNMDSCILDKEKALLKI